MLWARVKALTVFTSIQRSLTMSSSPSRNNRWSAPKEMWRMPCAMYEAITPQWLSGAAISRYGCDGCTMTDHER